MRSYAGRIQRRIFYSDLSPQGESRLMPRRLSAAALREDPPIHPAGSSHATACTLTQATSGARMPEPFRFLVRAASAVVLGVLCALAALPANAQVKLIPITTDLDAAVAGAAARANAAPAPERINVGI
jgi:hypothetical protein